MTETLLALLETSLSAEFGPKARVAALATVDTDGVPRVRHIVVRRLDPVGLWIAVDTRSAKVEHLRDRPFAEIAFWLPTLRNQFRLSGPVHLIDDPRSADRESIWQSMTESSRALFFWPDPGTPRGDDASRYPASIPHEAPIPKTFLLLHLVPDLIEHVELSPHPHRRRRWQAARAWQVEELNP